MREIYRVTIHGQTLEGRDLRQLLARAVSEKREMDRKMIISSGLRSSTDSGKGSISFIVPAGRTLEQAG